MPLSEEALVFARQLAKRKYCYPDDQLAVADLLERWNVGLGTTPAERRMALRLSREQAALELPESAEETVVSLPSVRQALGETEEMPCPSPETIKDVEGGDDDEADLEARIPMTSMPTLWRTCDGRWGLGPGESGALAQGRLPGLCRGTSSSPARPPCTGWIAGVGRRRPSRVRPRRRDWHANLGPLKTPRLAALHEDLWDILDSNLQDGDKAKGAVAVDAFPGLGKTTSVLAFARDFYCRGIAERGRSPIRGTSGGRSAGWALPGTLA